MEATKMYVVALLVLGVLAGSGEAIKCHTCVEASTNQECMDNGIILDCPFGSDTCQTSIRTNSEGVPAISKSCAVKSVCESGVLPEFCVGLYDALSVCSCCCDDSDKCNSALCGLAEENECVWRSSAKSSKKSSSKKSSSKKSGSKSGSTEEEEETKKRRKRSSKSKSGSKSKSKSGSKKSGSVVYCDSGMSLMASPLLLVSALLAKLW